MIFIFGKAKSMTVLNKIGNAILTEEKATKASLKQNPIETSELILVADDAGDFALSFDVLGQNFLLNSQGLFTFNEIGEAFELELEFKSSIMQFLDWRATTLEVFGI